VAASSCPPLSIALAKYHHMRQRQQKQHRPRQDTTGGGSAHGSPLCLRCRWLQRRTRPAGHDKKAIDTNKNNDIDNPNTNADIRAVNAARLFLPPAATIPPPMPFAVAATSMQAAGDCLQCHDISV
jgi:hypothetical protein